MGELSAEERRCASAPRRAEMLRQLNDEQRIELNHYERFGLQLMFVRQPMFRDPQPLLKHRGSGLFALLEVDGRLNYQHGLTIRPEQP